jgi:hypothetical protein
VRRSSTLRDRIVRMGLKRTEQGRSHAVQRSFVVCWRRLDQRFGIFLDRSAMPSRFTFRSTHEIPVDGLDGASYTILLANHLAHDFGLCNLLLICCSFLEGFRQCLGCELANSTSNVERFHTLRPERLITEERLNDSRLKRQMALDTRKHADTHDSGCEQCHQQCSSCML